MTTLNKINLNTIQILIIGDHNFLQPSLQVYLAAEIDLEIIGYAENAVITLAAMERQIPDVVIIDSEMSATDALTLIQTISDRFSQSKILVFSNNYDRKHIIQSIQMGARGYLLKQTPPKELVNTIRSIHLGYFQLGPGLLEKIAINHHHTNYLGYDYNDSELRVGNLFKEMQTELREQSQQLIDAQIKEHKHQLDEKLKLKLHRLKIKQADNSLYLKKLEKKVQLLLKFQIAFLIFCCLYWIFA
ncbi:MAG: response regulator transcription factor [Pleurocapsa sp.]